MLVSNFQPLNAEKFCRTLRFSEYGYMRTVRHPCRENSMKQRHLKGYNQVLFIKTWLCEHKTGSEKPVTQSK